MLLCASAVTASGAYRDFSYDPDGIEPEYFGTSKAETYDIAIRLDASLAGTRVAALSVQLNTLSDTEGDERIADPAATFTAPKGWISTELRLTSSKKNDPDICTVDGTVSPDGLLTVTFDESYTVPAGGVYVGYSVTVADAGTFAGKKPNAVWYSSDTNGMYVHTTRTYRKWINFVEKSGVISCLSVRLEGEFSDFSVGFTGNPVVDVARDDVSALVNTTVSNHGSGDVTSLGYTYRFADGYESTGSVTLDKAIPAKFGSRANVVLPVDNKGTGPLSITITEVNGNPNVNASATVEAAYNIHAFMPVTRVLMEEYTGLWCGFCPRGLVAMEHLSELYPDTFVPVSYHDGCGSPENLQYLTEFPSVVNGYPMSFLNRSVVADPYYGSAMTENFGIRDDVEQLLRRYAVADVDVELTWTDDSRTTLNCRSRVRFADDIDGSQYRISYVVLADGLTSIINLEDMSKSIFLNQSNYFSSETEAPDDYPLWDMIIGQPKTLPNLTFNDIAVAYKDQQGLALFPDDVKGGREYVNDYTYDYASILNTQGFTMVTDPGKLHCVAIITDADGRYVNCNRSEQVGTLGVESVSADSSRADVVATEWYDLQGRKVTRPAAGLYIRVDRLSDGTARTGKTVVRN